MLWIDFLNSEWNDWRGGGESEDRLDKPEWIAQFLERLNFSSFFPLDLIDINYLKELRAKLRNMTETLA